MEDLDRGNLENVLSLKGSITMTLSLEQIKTILFGAAEVSKENGIISAYKCTAPIREAWGTLHENFGTRAQASTGIRLDFHTDTTEVSFTLINKTFDCLVDGLLTERFAGEEEPTKFTLALDGKLHRVTLIFPSHNAGGKLCEVEVSDGAKVAPHVYGEKFLFLGDSITQGWDSDIDSLSYAWRTSLFFNADCRIHGVGGGYFHPSIFEGEDFDPDRVFVAFGTNDFDHFKTLDELRTYTSEYLDKVSAAFTGRPIYAITPIWRAIQKKPMGTFDECIAVIREEHKKRGFTVIDGLSLVPHRKEFFQEDGLHPNALGFSLYAQNLIRAILDTEK